MNSQKPIGSALIELLESHGVSGPDASNAAISILLSELAKVGFSLEQAFDIVLGKDSYKKLADDVYETLTTSK